MCGVELVAPTPLVAALTERLLGLRCQVTRSSCSGLGSHQNPSSSWWGPWKLHSRSQLSITKSWSQNPLAQKHLGVVFFFPFPSDAPFPHFFLSQTLRQRCAIGMPLPGRRLFPGPVGICHLEGCDATKLGGVEQVTAMFGPMIRWSPKYFLCKIHQNQPTRGWLGGSHEILHTNKK